MHDKLQAAPQAHAEPSGLEIAIVGMAGRFPGAADVDAFWANLRDGVESVKEYTQQELLALGVPAQTLSAPDYVKAGVPFEGADLFDAELFGYTPREAQRLDPQQRLFLECAWQALDNAGYDPRQWPGAVAVFAGAGANVYLLRHLLPRHGLGADSDIADLLELVGSNGAETLCTRVAYKLGLRGPAVTVQTACSTSLTAVHLAGQSLLAGECDMALAGGVSLNLLQQAGYRYQPGAILSPDGHCRAFDANAQGTVLGSGAGIVVLRRLDDALRDGDHIHAVIRATAANNDASDKIGFTAPGVNGQAAVIRAAHVLAGVSADSISYIEAHGTGTTLGDPIEVAALSQAFRASTARTGYCALGSVKTNIGHLDCAAGVAGLIKTALALRHQTLPASLHYREPNPRIDFGSSPFFVNAQTQPWEGKGQPRRAGVSGFGIGGTNVHAVLEEAPLQAARAGQAAPWQVLAVSAASEPALRQAVRRLADHLRAYPGQALEDVAHTLQVGRRALPLRVAVAASDHAGAATALEHGCEDMALAGDAAPQVVFMFPGGGAQHAHMCAALYGAYTVFRQEVDRCLAWLRSECGLELGDCLLPRPGHEEEAGLRLSRMEFGQPALFVASYAMARLWISLGVQPCAMVGHSLGEYVAACVAGVFSLQDALRIVVGRARLQQAQAPGAMTSVPLSQAEAQPFLADGCELAVVNGERLCVLAGPPQRIEAVEQALAARGHVPRRLHVAVAAHSSMTEPVMGALEELVATATLHAPRIAFISNVTGRPITDAQATSPAYWALHLRSTVRFGEGLGHLLATPGRIVLEVGPGDMLCSLARQHAQAAQALAILPSQAHVRQHGQNLQQWSQAAAGLWKAGVALDWSALAAGRARRRVPLPSYPFQRRSYWLPAVDEGSPAPSERTSDTSNTRRAIDDWFHAPVWRRVEPLGGAGGAGATQPGCTIVLGQAGPFTEALAAWLDQAGQGPVVVVTPGEALRRIDAHSYRLRPGQREDLLGLIRAVRADCGTIARVCHLWSLGCNPAPHTPEPQLFGVPALIQALGEAGPQAEGGACVPLVVASDAIQNVTGADLVHPHKAALLGLCKSAVHEYPGMQCRLIDLPAAAGGDGPDGRLILALGREIVAGGEPIVGCRAGCRWLLGHERVRRPAGAGAPLRTGGAYLITGGLGGLGLLFARHLAQHWQARLALLTSGELPPRAQWQALLASPQQDPRQHGRIRAILDLEAMGAEVLVLSADVGSASQVRQAVAAARERFGPLHGLIHAAGRPGGGLLAHQEPAALQSVLEPKIQGTAHLLPALRGEPLDFALLCSALVSLFGGLGQAAYCAANSGMDGLAQQAMAESPWPVVSVAWDVWRDVGMAAGHRLPDELGLHAQQAGELLQRILAGPATAQLLVSSVDLAAQEVHAQAAQLSQRLQWQPPAARGRMHPRPALATPYAEPSGEAQRVLAGIWSELLGVSPIGADDNLFELGGDSLLAVQAVSRARAALKADLPVAEVLRLPTPAHVAGLLAQGHAPGARRMAIEAAVARADGLLQASHAQQRLWFLWRMEPQRVAFNITRAFRMEGALDAAAVRQAVAALVARHAVLRTVFVEETGVAMQCILPRMDIDVPLLDLTATAAGGVAQVPVDARLQAHLLARVGEPFDLATGPLLRAELVRVDVDVHVFVVVMHHVAMDGWSVSLLMKEFAQLYAAASEGRDAALAPPAHAYADFAVAQRRWLEDGEMARQADYWRRQLQGVEPLALPPDRQPPQQRRHPVSIAKFQLDAGLAEQLRAASRAHSVTPYALLLAATSLVLSERSQQRLFHVGTDMANRNQVETEAMIGFFVNLAAIRVDCDTPATMAQLMAQLQATVVDAASHQDLPFDRLVEVVGRRASAGRAPLFQTKVLYRDDSEAHFSLPGLSVGDHPLDPVEAELDLMVSFLALGQQLHVEIAYDSDLYAAQTMQALYHELLDTLQACLADPGASLDALRTRLAQMRAAARARDASERAGRMAAMRSGLLARPAHAQ